MDAKSALKLIDEVCAEIEQKQKTQSRLGALMKKARPLGLGLALGLASAGCGDDSSSKIPGPDSAYGIPDSYQQTDAGVDLIPGADSAYGIPVDAGHDLLPGADSAYGIPVDAGHDQGNGPDYTL